MEVQHRVGTRDKALQINLDARFHGTFAEIGAGQEVARCFFHVGGAAGTVAKSISAYDMKVSDTIYGHCDRYVSRRRLDAMLNHEYRQLVDWLDSSRGEQTCFFAFANTVATRGYSRHGDSHGWVGVRFQTRPRTEPSQIVIHVRMLDRENAREQEALGAIGVNLLYGAFDCHEDPERLIGSLLDDLSPERMEVDMIEFSGVAFQQVDNRLMSLQLVEQELTGAAMFRADGQVVQPADALHNRAVVVERGSFRPVNNLNVDMLERAESGFYSSLPDGERKPLVLLEMTLRNLLPDTGFEHQDFLDRADTLATLGATVLISSYGEYYRLTEYLSRFTNNRIGVVVGVPALKEILDDKYYADLGGGVLEACGRLFQSTVKLFVYPCKDRSTGIVTNADDLQVTPNLVPLLTYLRKNRLIEPIREYNEACLDIQQDRIIADIQKGDAVWQSQVPPSVAACVKERRLFDYHSQ